MQLVRVPIMPIIIKKIPKAAAGSSAKAVPASSSAATPTLAASNTKKTLPENPAQQHTPNTAPKPFIDKISIIAVPEGKFGGKDILKKLNASVSMSSHLAQAKPWKEFKRAYRIAPHKLIAVKTKWPVILFKVVDDAVHKVRIEFSPVDISGSEMKHLDSVLRSFLPNGWGFFAALGKVTMIEVSVDLPLVETDFVHPLPQQTTTVKTWGTGGTLETIYLGKGKGNFTRIYDRGVKRKAKGQHSPEYHGTRVERVLRPNGKLAVKDLAGLPNPFSGLAFIKLPSARPPDEKKDYLWQMFRDTVRVRGLPSALKLLPVEKRTAYRKWLAAHPEDWWSPDEIWKHWVNTVTVDGLDDPNFWLPLPEEMDAG